MHMACQVNDNERDVVFLYRLVDGVCPKSYGMHVACMAGVSESIVARAEEKAQEMISNKGWIGAFDLQGDKFTKGTVGVRVDSNQDQFQQPMPPSSSLMVQSDFQLLVDLIQGDDATMVKNRHLVESIIRSTRVRYGN
jgi:DNA mismatch repair ATPase MutS